MKFNGGSFSNGTIKFANERNSCFYGYEFLHDTIIVYASIVYIDWFKSYKISLDDYKSYRSNITVDTAPNTTMDDVPNTNNNIVNNHKSIAKSIVFGNGLYVFSSEITAHFVLGSSRETTLLFFPNSNGFRNNSATHSFIKRMSIIAKNDAITFEGIHHGQICEELYVTSYTGDAFVDKGLVYGGLFKNIDACAGNDRYMFNNFGSNSNVFDRVVDPALDFISKEYPVNIGVMNAFFLNGGSQSYRNANILYYGAKYFLRYGDENTPTLNARTFKCENCTFENNANGFENLVYCNDTQASNMYFIFRDILFINTNYKNSLHFYTPKMVNVSISCNLSLNVWTGNGSGNNGAGIIYSIMPYEVNKNYAIDVIYPYTNQTAGRQKCGQVSLEINDYNKNLLGVSDDIIPDDYKELTFRQLRVKTMPALLSCVGIKSWASNQAFGNIAYDETNNEFSIGAVSGNAKLILAINRERVSIIKTLDELKFVRSQNFAGAYIIADDIDLQEEELTFNNKANLIFMGGSLNNGIINNYNSVVGFKGTATSIYNHEKGTFSQKPTSNLTVGQSYFCTDKQTTEGATNGIMIYYKGEDVWVDALGRVVE